jgi:SAM-dependent methyltransferase
MADDDLPFELESMASAVRYQEWVFETIRPSLGASILEVGAGIGTMTRWLANYAPTAAIDIDSQLLALLRQRSGMWQTAPIEVATLDISQPPQPLPDWMHSIDTVVSFNVLEHIDDDVAALRGMAEVLRESSASGKKRIVIFVPAHQWAFGEIDTAFAHFRRYSRALMRERVLAAGLGPCELRVRYFNSVGLPGWVVIGRVARRSTFSSASVRTMERIIPFARKVDTRLARTLGVPFGQSLVTVIELK